MRTKSGGHADDAYELYVYSLLLYAATVAHCDVQFYMTSGQRAQDLVFRHGPGDLPKNQYSHAVVTPPRSARRRQPIEVHIGVRVEGHSSVGHECDIAVLTQYEASRSRHFGQAPSNRGLRAVVECKLYSKKLPLAHGRGMLGMAHDYGKYVLQVSLVTNSQPTDSITTLVSARQRRHAALNYVTELKPPALKLPSDELSIEEARFVCRCAAFWKRHFKIPAPVDDFDGFGCEGTSAVELV